MYRSEIVVNFYAYHIIDVNTLKYTKIIYFYLFLVHNVLGNERILSMFNKSYVSEIFVLNYITDAISIVPQAEGYCQIDLKLVQNLIYKNWDLRQIFIHIRTGFFYRNKLLGNFALRNEKKYKQPSKNLGFHRMG